MTSWVLWWYGA